jgi:G3E family GTPase
MGAKLKFEYDREGDILYINKCDPYPEQESEELGDDVVTRLNPRTRDVENVEVLFFSPRLLRKDLFEIPVIAEFKLTSNN